MCELGFGSGLGSGSGSAGSGLGLGLALARILTRYHVLYLLHIGTTLFYYYSHISSAHALGVYYSDGAASLTAQTLQE